MKEDQKPQDISLDKSALREWHSNMINAARDDGSKIISSGYLPDVDNFIKQIGEDRDYLLDIRYNVINDHKEFDDAQFGGDEETFLSSFLKKKEPSPSSESQSDITSEKEPQAYPTGSIGNFELDLFDFDNQTDAERVGKDYVDDSYNHNAALAKLKDEKIFEHMAEDYAKWGNDVSNAIAEKKKGFSVYRKSEEAPGPIGRIIKGKSPMLQYFEDTEDAISKEFNKEESRSTDQQIRAMVIKGHLPAFVNDFDGYIASIGVTPYDAVTNSKYMNEWEKNWKNHVPGELFDQMNYDLYKKRDNLIVDNENHYHIKDRIQEVMDRGVPYEEASRQIYSSIEKEKYDHFLANSNKESVKRAELQTRLDELRRNPDVNAVAILNAENEMANMNPSVYDEHGRVIHFSPVEKVAKYDQDVNDEINDIIQNRSTFRDDLQKYHHDNWLIYNNLLRLARAHGKEMVDKNAQAPITGVSMMWSAADESRAEELDAMVREAKLRVDATGRMLFANENLALATNKRGKKGAARFYGREFFDELASHNKWLFSDPTKDMSTPAKDMEMYINAKKELGWNPSPEEEEAADVETKLHMVREAAAWTDIGLKMAATNMMAGSLGVTAAVDAFATQTLKYGGKILKIIPNVDGFAYRGAQKTIDYLAQSAWEGAKFNVIGGDFGTGVAFYGAQAMFNGIPPFSLGNRHLTRIANTLLKGPATMTASFESVAAVETSIKGIWKDRRVQDDLHEYFGDMNEVQQRVAVEWTLGGIMGAGALMGGKAKGLFRFNAEYLEQIAKLAEKNGYDNIARDVRNFQYKYSEVFEAQRKHDDYYNKFKWLTEKNAYSEKDFLGTPIEGKPTFKYEKIDAEIDKLVANDVVKYEEIVGPGSMEVLERKRKILKDLDLYEGKSPGEIQAIFEENVTSVKKEGFLSGVQFALKPGMSTGRKVSKAYDKEVIRERRAMIKGAEKEMRNLLDPATGALAENTDEYKKSLKEDKIIKSEERMEFEKSYNQAVRDLSPENIGAWKSDYTNMARESYVKGPEGEVSRPFNDHARNLTGELLAKTQNMMALLEEAGMTETNHYKNIEGINKNLLDHFAKEKYFSNKSAIDMAEKITDSLNAFRAQNMRTNITDMIESHLPIENKKREPSGPISPEAQLFIEVADAMFHKSMAERGLYESGKKGEISNYEKVLERVTGNIQRIIDSRERGMEKDPGLWEKTDNSIYEAASNAMKRTDRGEALKRRRELEEWREDRELTRAEQIEYDLLLFADGGRMSSHSLAEATQKLMNVINTGKTKYESERQSEKIREDMMQYETARMLNPKNVDIKTKQVIDPGLFEKEMNKFQKAWKGRRSTVESMPTLMELLQSRTPGNKPFKGGLHQWTNKALVAELDKAGEVGYWSRVLIDEVYTPIFGTPERAIKEINKWGKEHRIQLTRSGKPTEEIITVGQLMSWYANSRQPSESSTFNRGKFKMNADGTVSKEAIAELKSELKRIGGQKAVDYVHAITGNLLPRMGSRVSSRHIKDKGVDMSMGENYFPVSRIELATTEQKDVREAGSIMRDHLKYVNTGVTKERTEATHWYDKADFNDILYDYIQSSMHYVHYQGFINDMRSTWQNPDIRKTVENNYGERTSGVIDKLTSDLAAGRASGERNQGIDALKTMLTRGVLGIKPMLLPKQLTSMNAFQAELSPTEAIEWMAELAKPDFKLMYQLANSPEIILRYQGDAWSRELYADTKKYKAQDIAHGKNRGKIKMIKGRGIDAMKWENFKDNQLIMTKFGDLTAIIGGGAPFYKVRKRTYEKQGFSEPEAHQKAYNDFYEATRRTQQSGALMDLSHIQRGGTIGSLATLFLNSPMQYLRGEMGSITNMYEGFRQGDASKFAGGLKNFTIYHFVLPMLFQAAQSGFYFDRDEKWWKLALEDPSMLNTMIIGSLKGTPMAGAFGEGVISKVTTGSSFDWMKTILGSGAENIDGFMDLVTESLHSWDEQGLEPITIESILDASAELLSTFGLPTSGLYNIGIGVHDLLTESTDNWWAALGMTEWARGERQNMPYFIKDIKKFLPDENGGGGDVNSFIAHMRKTRGEKWVDSKIDTLYRLHNVYSKYTTNDYDVNYLMFGATNTRSKAAYILDLHKAHVNDKRLVAGKLNPRKNIGIKDVLGKVHQSDSEFTTMVFNWALNGVISEETYVAYMTMLTDSYEQVYQWKLPDE